MKNTLAKIIGFVLLSLGSAFAQDNIPKSEPEPASRLSMTNGGPATYSYDAAGNRIKRISTSGNCVNTWTGNVNELWNVAGNWSEGVVPEPCQKVVIPLLSGKPYPVLNVNATVYGIDFAGGNLAMNGFDITLSAQSSCPAGCP
ncbi:hypothetical protein [Dyadobacter aurulentus]|uniref:hypothetical protein n=1 Tax=Dyadobacter sp. UC 10 TaxID=2605428 RepID=UPI0011F1B8F4|nr:hypothetical protein [Dyadobacter sp. UC 10]KAA0990472.1 hypothetical protein FXO21_10050 [Dyadobacter sp. UC 10]